MSEINEVVKPDTRVVDAIYAYHKKLGDSQPKRQYLGMSEIGGPCERRLWYSYRGLCKAEFDGRMFRLFETGNLAEARFVKELRGIGCEVHDIDTNQCPHCIYQATCNTNPSHRGITGCGEPQFTLEALGGKFRGHMDGCALGTPGREKTWVGLEFKTHSSKSFAKLTKEGVAVSKPQHYCQCQCYMGVSGLRRFLYLAVNKDTDELYSEIIRYDQAAFDALVDRAWHVINDAKAPDRISTREDYYECSWCPAKKLCWNPMILKAEEVFDAVVTGYRPEDILNRYPSSDTRLMRQMDAKYLKEEWKRLYNEDIEKLEPIAKEDGFDFQAAEFPGGRCVIVWADKKCEIREGIQ